MGPTACRTLLGSGSQFVTETVPTPMQDLECPPELPPVACDEWNRIVGELIALGVLSKFDRGPLAIYCGAFAMWIEAMDALPTIRYHDQIARADIRSNPLTSQSRTAKPR